MSRFRPWLPVLAVSLAFLFACDSQEEEQPNGIVLGKSIAGIEIGMDSAEVLLVLERPDSVVVSDSFPGVIYQYGRELEVEFNGLPIFPRGVASICALENYRGTSSEGLGIGSSHQEVTDSLSHRLSQSWSATAPPIGPETTAFRSYFDWDSTVMSFESEEPRRGDGSTSPLNPHVKKICLMPTDRPFDWIDPPGQIFFPTDIGEIQIIHNGCASLRGPWVFWRLECDFIETNRIPAELRVEGQMVLVSGVKLSYPHEVDIPGGRPVLINTIRRVN